LRVYPGSISITSKKMKTVLIIAQLFFQNPDPNPVPHPIQIVPHPIQIVKPVRVKPRVNKPLMGVSKVKWCTGKQTPRIHGCRNGSESGK
jgi:hypothetical protein